MGNCTSKKSSKALKLSTSKKSTSSRKMEKEDLGKGLSKKIAPFTKGEATSFGFKRRPVSALPAPVTLTSKQQDTERERQGILKNRETLATEQCQSGSSVESLCHAPMRGTPKMVRKRDLYKQNNNPTTTEPVPNNNNNINNNNTQTNRFGFRTQTPPRATTAATTAPVPVKNSPHVSFSNSGPYSTSVDTGTFRINRNGTRSRSEGPREAFFKQSMQPATSMHSVASSVPRAAFSSSGVPPGKFTLQTSQLPRPQFPVRMPDTKIAKTVTNYYRRGGGQSDSSSSKEGSLNEDSGIESQRSSNSVKSSKEESPGFSVRRRLTTSNGKKLEMRVMGNKFELLNKTEIEDDPTVVTEVSVIKLPAAISGVRTSTAVINTGLVEERTNQYLRKITSSQSFLKDSNRRRPVCDTSSDSSHHDEGIGAESEEEKLFKDSKRSEKHFSQADGSGDGDDLMPGEAMAEEVSFSSDDDTPSEVIPKIIKQSLETRPLMDAHTALTPNSIRLDALKLSQQLKSAHHCPKVQLKIEDTSLGVITSCADIDDETFPSDSILDQLSSEESDSLGDKGENKNNDKEKNLKADINIVVEKTDELELDVEFQEVQNLPLDAETPDSPDTPSNASNSLSLSEGRDFLIDDEIADQPELCFNDNAASYHDCSCHESEMKTHNSKTMTSSANNNEFVTASEVTDTVLVEALSKAVNKPVGLVAPTPAERTSIQTQVSPIRQERRRCSVGTLSPCESLTSDDLMLDLDDRLDLCNDDCSLDGVDSSCNGDEVLKEISSMSSLKNSFGGGSGRVLRSHGGSGSSTPGSPRSLDPRLAANVSPMRSRASTTDDEFGKIDKASYQHIFNDISEGSLIENGIKLCDGIDGENDEISDLKKQVMFLQQQLEERERKVQDLQSEVGRCRNGEVEEKKDCKGQCNAATQTDRLRPVSTGPSIVQNLPSDSANLVSDNSTNVRRPVSNVPQPRQPGSVKNGISHDDRNTRSFVAVQANTQSDHVSKIMEKVKELSFKPVEPIMRDENNHVTAKQHVLAKRAEVCRNKPNVFKITKIDLVLKSDNYGKKEVTKT